MLTNAEEGMEVNVMQYTYYNSCVLSISILLVECQLKIQQEILSILIFRYHSHRLRFHCSNLPHHCSWRTHSNKSFNEKTLYELETLERQLNGI